ncbi:AhpC/TSA family protein [Flavobacterium terrae]|uniref:AhpC/TSA family protein n=2 Tax=Flavobacterium terrae TaxID=415425 RepID=A0A1M6GCM2_9FLAO|nr:AhpC/TSA family protein [Flavobacterium terrae]
MSSKYLNMKRIGLLLLFISSFAFSQQSSQEYLKSSIPIKEYVKDGITVKSFDFNSFEPYLHQNDETTYVINFWATWCLPCVKELPYFEQLNEKYKGQNVKVILVSLDLPKKVESNLIPFIKKKNLKSEIIHLNDPDANTWIEKVDKSWAGSIPATVIYNKNSRVFAEDSYSSLKELEEELLTIIKK